MTVLVRDSGHLDPLAARAWELARRSESLRYVTRGDLAQAAGGAAGRGGD